MLTVFAVLMTGVVAFLVCARATTYLAANAPLRARNYRGLDVPTATGLAVVLGFLAGLSVIALFRAVGGIQAPLAEGALLNAILLAAAGGYCLLGLWDDLAGDAGERGWSAHFKAIRSGRATSGAIKVSGGFAIALIIVAPSMAGVMQTLADTALVALSANAVNLLDLRPGRASKAVCIAGVMLLVTAGPAAPALVALIGAVAAFLPFDLRERAMLGDTGANALGGILGVVMLVALSSRMRLAALVVLVILHIVGQRPGLSRIIAKVAPLRRLDQAGRVPES